MEHMRHKSLALAYLGCSILFLSAAIHGDNSWLLIGLTLGAATSLAHVFLARS